MWLYACSTRITLQHVYDKDTFGHNLKTTTFNTTETNPLSMSLKHVARYGEMSFPGHLNALLDTWLSGGTLNDS